MGRKKKVVEEIVEEVVDPVVEPPADIMIRLIVTTPNGAESFKEIRIINPTGCILKSQVNNVGKIFANLTGGLAAAYGARHIK